MAIRHATLQDACMALVRALTGGRRVGGACAMWPTRPGRLCHVSMLASNQGGAARSPEGPHSMRLVLRRLAVGALLAANGLALPAVATSPVLALLAAGGQELWCEHDAQWLDVKSRLYFLLDQIEGEHRMDLARCVGLLTRGITESDFARCPVGAAAVKLFLQLLLALSDPMVGAREIDAELGGESWQDLAAASWSALLTSRWPFFEPLALLRVALRRGGTGLTACDALWDALPGAQQAAITAADDAGDVMGVLLDLSPGTCGEARAAASLSLLGATAPYGSHAAGEQLLRRAQDDAGNSWPRNLLYSSWPALPLLSFAERRSLRADVRQGFVGELRGVIAYVHFSPREMARFHDLDKSLESIQEYWLDNAAERWPVLIFADSASAEAQEATLRERFPRLDLRVVVIDERDLSWPMPHEHPFCSQGYRRAARFTAGPLYLHPALDSFSHILLVDTEFEFTHAVPWDPFRHMHEQRGQLAYWQTHYEQTWNRTVYLTEISREFMDTRGLQPQVPELVRYWWDYGTEEVPGGSFPVNIYGCLFAGALTFFRSELFQSYFRTLDQWEGWSEHCWSPQNVLAIAAGFFLSDIEISELWVFGRHQKSTKTPGEGWNLSGKGILPSSLLRSSQQSVVVVEEPHHATPGISRIHRTST